MLKNLKAFKNHHVHTSPNINITIVIVIWDACSLSWECCQHKSQGQRLRKTAMWSNIMLSSQGAHILCLPDMGRKGLTSSLRLQTALKRHLSLRTTLKQLIG